MLHSVGKFAAKHIEPESKSITNGETGSAAGVFVVEMDVSVPMFGVDWY